MEFLNLVVIFTAGYLVWRRPQHEKVAFGLVVASVLLMMTLFSLATRTSWLPGVNY